MARPRRSPPRPKTGRVVPARRGTDVPYQADRRHQPWLPDAVPLPVPDDFSRDSVTHRLRGVALGVALAALVLAMGRSAQILDAAYGLDTLPGTETVIAAAEGWHAAMTWLGVPDALAALRTSFGVSAE